MKLSTDNPDTMPITDAVYGKAPAHPDKPPRLHRAERELWSILPLPVLDALARRGKATRHMAAQRRRAA